MRSVTWTQVAQYIILIISYLVPVVYLSWQLFCIPDPRADLRQGAPARTTPAPSRSRATPRRRRRARSGRRTPTRSPPRSRRANLPEAEVDKLKAQAALAIRQATAPAASDDAKLGRYLTVPTGDRHVELPRPDLLPHGRHGGAAPHPDALLHDALGAPGAHLGGVVAVLHLPALLHRAGLRGLRAVRDLRQARRHEDRRAAAVGDAVAARRPLRRRGQERGRHRPVGGLRGQEHRLRRARHAGDRRACPS